MSRGGSRNDDAPRLDPYEVLGVPFGASDADITRAYRKKALQLHPDKQKKPSRASGSLVDIAQKFQDVQDARSFLLENPEGRRKYDTRRASQDARRRMDEAHHASMSDRRKRMKQELEKKEAEALRQKQEKDNISGARPAKDQQRSATVDELRRKGQTMREDYGDKVAAREEREAAKQRQQAQDALDDRRVRIKWSRKKMKESPSEHSLAQDLANRFGAVESVDMLGNKGNAALVTFTSPGSVTSCVQAFLTSESMRATYVGRRKDREEEADTKRELEAMRETTMSTRSRDAEDINDWKIRSAAERERILREMEANESKSDSLPNEPRAPDSASPRRFKSLFPPSFPKTEEYERLTTPLEKLELAESQILASILSSAAIQDLRIQLD
jgi:DnaJ homolog subfamily C member 17